MRTIARDLVDLAVVSSAYRRKYDTDVPAHLWDDWTEIFVKGLRLSYPLNDRLGDMLVDPENVESTDQVYSAVTQAVLNCVEIGHYLDSTGQWSESTLDVRNHVRPSNYSRILELFVYDIFTNVNVLPAPAVDITRAAFGPIVAVFDGGGVVDDASVRRLCGALVGHGLLPVLPETGLRYCLQAYYTETDNSELARALDNDDGGAANVVGGPIISNYIRRFIFLRSKRSRDTFRPSAPVSRAALRHRFFRLSRFNRPRPPSRSSPVAGTASAGDQIRDGGLVVTDHAPRRVGGGLGDESVEHVLFERVIRENERDRLRRTVRSTDGSWPVTRVSISHWLGSLDKL